MKRKIILTPECNKLWIINPSVFFNYDCVVLDDRDYQKLLNPSKDTFLTQTISKTVFKLKEFGLIEPIDYESLFDDNVKKSIHRQSQRLVQKFVSEIGDDLKSSRFYQYSIHTHVEFANYLEQFIMECSFENIEEFNSYSSRYKVSIRRNTYCQPGDLAVSLMEKNEDDTINI
tara:strand:+ start:23163 stop:23681 length:519 start_codon:yes stop_codon:yes gene_type:complete